MYIQFILKIDKIRGEQQKIMKETYVLKRKKDQGMWATGPETENESHLVHTRGMAMSESPNFSETFF